MSKKGMEWLLQNQDRLILKKQKAEGELPLSIPDDDIPF
jgi:hypothetical protein